MHKIRSSSQKQAPLVIRDPRRGGDFAFESSRTRVFRASEHDVVVVTSSFQWFPPDGRALLGLLELVARAFGTSQCVVQIRPTVGDIAADLTRPGSWEVIASDPPSLRFRTSTEMLREAGPLFDALRPRAHWMFSFCSAEGHEGGAVGEGKPLGVEMLLEATKHARPFLFLNTDDDNLFLLLPRSKAACMVTDELLSQGLARWAS